MSLNFEIKNVFIFERRTNNALKALDGLTVGVRLAVQRFTDGLLTTAVSDARRICYDAKERYETQI